MFCSKCGKNLSDDAKFCDGCGAAVDNAQPVQPNVQDQQMPNQQVPNGQYQQMPNQQVPNGQYQQMPNQQVPNGQYQQMPNQQMPNGQYQQIPNQQYAKPAAPNPIITNFVASLKNVFSKNPANAVEVSSKSNTLEWIVSFVIAILTFALTFVLNFKQMITFLSKSVAGVGAEMVDVSGIIKFGPWFLYGIVIGAVSIFAVGLGVFVVGKSILKLNMTIHNAFNIVGSASLILSAVCIINIIIGFIFAPLTTILLCAAIISFAALIYIALQKLSGTDAPLFLAFSICALVVIIISMLVSSLCFKAGVNGIIENAKNMAQNSLF